MNLCRHCPPPRGLQVGVALVGASPRAQILRALLLQCHSLHRRQRPLFGQGTPATALGIRAIRMAKNGGFIWSVTVQETWTLLN